MSESINGRWDMDAVEMLQSRKSGTKTVRVKLAMASLFFPPQRNLDQPGKARPIH
jgi:hypothetical protein